MIKWPEPVIAREEYAIGSGEYYTEAQLKQAVRDALEEAVGLCDDDNTANAIRALIKEIE